jgi:hypothetical protein
MAFTGPLKFEESISLEHRFNVIKLHALRLGEESSPTSSVTNQPTESSSPNNKGLILLFECQSLAKKVGVENKVSQGLGWSFLTLL